MSVKVMAWVWDSDLTVTPKMVLLAIADKTDEDGRCVYFRGEEASQARLAEKCGASVRTIKRTIQELQEIGMLSVSRPGRTEANEYQVLVPWSDTARGQIGTSSTRGQVVTSEVPNLHKGGATVAPRSSLVHKNINTHEGVSEKITSIMASFEVFWNLYPRKIGKADALRKYEKAIRDGAQHAEIYDGLRRYIKTLEEAGTEPRFIAHPGTWLHQGRWMDEHDSTGPEDPEPRPADMETYRAQQDKPWGQDRPW